MNRATFAIALTASLLLGASAATAKPGKPNGPGKTRVVKKQGPFKKSKVTVVKKKQTSSKAIVHKTVKHVPGMGPGYRPAAPRFAPRFRPGRITPAEAARLARLQRVIDRTRARFLVNGWLSFDERRQLTNLQVRYDRTRARFLRS